ncbi:hypothetical protein [Saccharopolyspora sp. 6V]|uniref:hypothetical protein n=1 Tax=Saccharopolyspora sp. 6V TaxID=2877239 RepID=UPI001CD6C1F8|nr:hypothetical protein [Saccharopolyspora sp. 6V]
MVWSAGCGLGRACSRPYCCALKVPRARPGPGASCWLPGGRARGRRSGHRQAGLPTRDDQGHERRRARARREGPGGVAQPGQRNSAPSTVALPHAWSEWLRAGELEESTRHTYEGYLRRTILPALGGTAVNKISARMLESVYSDLRPHPLRRHAADREARPRRRARMRRVRLQAARGGSESSVAVGSAEPERRTAHDGSRLHVTR